MRVPNVIIVPLVASLLNGGIRSFGHSVSPPSPYGPTPSARQLRYQEMKFYGFIHFGLNTFTDQEWGDGDISPSLFNPTEFNAEKIVQTLKDSGMRGVVLVCKHNDGFCLWPSRYTRYSVKASPWENGKGDVVGDISDACHNLGIKFGVYLSPWDRHRGDYGSPEYITYYRNQLRELLGNYGKVFIYWIDGSQGKSGYYGGARDSRVVNRATYYHWPTTWKLVRQLQPMAVIFSDAGPDVRWIGNEFGGVPQTCWYAINLQHGYPGMPHLLRNDTGVRAGTQYVPPECDVSIRPGWFYHKRQDISVKSPAGLVDLYYASVGHGACLNLNVPLNKRGMIDERDAASLRGMHKWLTETFATNLISGAKLEASSVRGNDEEFAAANVLDNNHNTAL